MKRGGSTSLIRVHIVTISFAILGATLYAAWCLFAFFGAAAGAGTLAVGILSAIIAVGLALYLRRFVRRHAS